MVGGTRTALLSHENVLLYMKGLTAANGVMKWGSWNMALELALAAARNGHLQYKLLPAGSWFLLN